MLRITIARSAAGATAYYTEALSKEDYFFGDTTVSAFWQGKTAALLGLEGKEVTRDTFSALAHNQHPITGKQLTVRNQDNRRSGVEFCFNAPKSASVAYAITKDKKILEAHRKGIQAAMAEIERDMQTQANAFGRKFYDTTGNLIYSSFEHFTSRPSETKLASGKAYIPDPHLHSHSFVPNLTWIEEKQRYQALEVGTVWTLSPYYEALYHSVFSKALEDAGFGIERTADRWEIQGISREVIEKYSNRTLAIEKEALDKGITNAKEKSKLGARTRVKKNKGVAENSLYALWEERLSPKELDAVRGAKNYKKEPLPSINATLAVEKAINHFCERLSAFPEKRVLGQAMAYGYGTLTPDEVKQALAQRTDIISAEKQSITYITTREMLRAEDKMLEFATSTKGTVPPLNKHYKVERDFLSEEQKEAVKHLLSSNDRVSILLGSAGVGKTSLLLEVKRGIEQNDKKLFGFAPSANASRGVLRDKGFEDADTIAALLQKTELQEAVRNQVLLIDEAGMVGLQDMNRIFEIAQKYNSRVILSGDPKQHNSVNAGDALRQLQEKSQLRPAVVNTIVRQKGNDEYRSAVQVLAGGDTLKGFQKLDKMGSVIEIEDAAQRQEAIAAAYVKSLEEKRSALIVSPSHAEGDTLTQAVRDKLKKTGKLTGEERVFETQKPVSFTEAQKQDVAQYQQGMLVRFHQNVLGGFQAGQHYRIAERMQDGKVWMESDNGQNRLALPFEAAEQFQVYQPTQTPIAKGDQLKVTVNGKTMEGSRISNGQVYGVKGFSPEGHIQLSNGKLLDKDFRNFKHGYVETSYSSQGKDAQDVFIAQSALSLPASGEKQFYVSASRGTEKISIYTDNKSELQQAIQRDTDRMTAQEVAEKAQQQKMQQVRSLQRDYYNQETNKAYEREHREPNRLAPKTNLSRDGFERE